jgi:hypothetical protein
MQITDLLTQMGGLQSIARELGVDQRQAASGVEALLPAVLGGFKKQAQAQPAGIEGLGGLLGQLGGGALLDNVLAPQPTDLGRGNDVLGQIFGSKDVSRAVAGDAASRTGLDASLLKKMLPMLAMLVAGLMAKGQGDAGELSSAAGAAPGGLGGLGGLGGGGSAGAGGLGDLLGGLLGGGRPGAVPGGAGGAAGGLASMLDLDGNGNPLDDILRMVGKGLR